MGEVALAGSPLPVGTPVAIAGHDHLGAALAVGAVRPRLVFNSIGTAETLLGALDGWRSVEKLGSASGLSFGQHVLAGHHGKS